MSYHKDHRVLQEDPEKFNELNLIFGNSKMEFSKEKIFVTKTLCIKPHHFYSESFIKRMKDFGESVKNKSGKMYWLTTKADSPKIRVLLNIKNVLIRENPETKSFTNDINLGQLLIYKGPSKKVYKTSTNSKVVARLKKGSPVVVLGHSLYTQKKVASCNWNWNLATLPEKCIVFSFIPLYDRSVEKKPIYLSPYHSRAASELSKKRRNIAHFQANLPLYGNYNIQETAGISSQFLSGKLEVLVNGQIGFLHLSQVAPDYFKKYLVEPTEGKQ